MAPTPEARRILLVEDNADNRGLIRQALEDLDVELIEATNGEDGVRLAHAHLPALILMDLSLPQVSGWEATARLKASPATASIPIIAVTAHAMAGDERRAREAGCDHYLTKPLTIGVFVALIERLLAELAAEARP